MSLDAKLRELWQAEAKAEQWPEIIPPRPEKPAPNPNIYVNVTRAKGGFGMDYVLRDGNGREISRERKP